MVLDISKVSNTPITEALLMPANLEAQPELCKALCPRCIRAWAAAESSLVGLSSAEAKAQTDIVAAVCERENSLLKCARCKKGKHDCDEIPTEFHRACNILYYFWKVWEPSRGNAVRYARVVEYAGYFEETLKAWNKAQKARIKAAGSEKEYSHTRQVSREFNQGRHDKGLGSIGQRLPTNVVVSRKMEQFATGLMDFASQRYYYYGVDSK